MYWKKNIYVFLIVTVFFSNCKKNNGIPVYDCEDIPSSHNPLGYQFQLPQFSYDAPCFNPSNPNEIIYIRKDNNINITELRKYNLITNQNSVITSNIWEHPNWSSKGWIVFNHADNQVWKIKDNGDSLTQLTFQGGLYAIWNATGDKIAFSNQVSSTFLTFTINNSGIVLDTFYYPSILFNGAWSLDNSKIATTMGYNNIGYIDINTKQFHKVYDYEGVFNGIAWLPDSQNFIWCCDKGIFKTNINTGNTTQIKSGCKSKTYQFPSVSSNGNKIIVQRINQKLIAENTIWSESNLYIMDIDGKNEIKLEIH